MSNVALAVQPELDYVELKKKTGTDWTIILAEARAGAVLGDDYRNRWETVGRFPGSMLVGRAIPAAAGLGVVRWGRR